MIVLNITKPTSQNILYQCDFFKVNNPFVTVDIFKERDYEISDSTLFQQLEKENDNFYQAIKSENEEELYQIAYEILKECYTEKFLPEKDDIIEIDSKKYKKYDVVNRIKGLKEIE